MSSLPSLRTMLDNGVHFGHVTAKWNPKMKPFIFTSHEKVHIINLEQTRQKLEQALQFLGDTVSHGGTILFVGTKTQAKTLVKDAAVACGMPYVTSRWLGGSMTNFAVMRKNVAVLEEIEANEAKGAFDHLTKKERLKIDEKKRKLLNVLGGLRDMLKLPNAVFVIDSVRESIVVNECHSLGIPIVALIDTNADPASVDYPIPANDDAPKSLSLLLGIVAGHIKEARGRIPQAAPVVEAPIAATVLPAVTEAPDVVSTESVTEPATAAVEPIKTNKKPPTKAKKASAPKKAK